MIRPLLRSTQANDAPFDGERGFSLVEILTSLAIVSILVVILLQSNATAMKAMHLARRTSQATLLCQDIMNRSIAIADIYGFGENDVHDKGNFERAYPTEYPGWTWEWSLAKTELTIPDLSGFMDQAGVDDDTQQQNNPAGTLAALGGTDMLEEMLGNYIREVRVRVCYPTGKTTQDCIEMVSHVANPGGRLVGEEEMAINLDRMGAGAGDLPDIFEEEE